VVSEVKQFMKNRLKSIQENDYKEYKVALNNDNKTTDLYLAISQLIQAKIEKFEDDIELRFKGKDKKLYDPYTGQMMDVLDLIKACPKCGEIWYLTEGGGTAVCGEKGSEKDISPKKQMKYNFTMKE
jgi:hypothetical protein